MDTLPIQINDITYVDARWIEKTYKLSRCKCRRNLIKNQVVHLVAFHRYFYNADEVKAVMKKTNADA